MDVAVAETTTTNGRHTFEAETTHFTGEEVRAYLAQRNNLPGGDFHRVKRQQRHPRAMLGKLFSSETFTDPGKLDVAMLAVTSAVSVDEELSNRNLLGLAYSLRNVTPGGIEFFTAQVRHGDGGAGERRPPGPDGRRAQVEAICGRTRWPGTRTSSATRRSPKSLTDRAGHHGCVPARWTAVGRARTADSVRSPEVFPDVGAPRLPVHDGAAERAHAGGQHAGCPPHRAGGPGGGSNYRHHRHR